MQITHHSREPKTLGCQRHDDQGVGQLLRALSSFPSLSLALYFAFTLLRKFQYKSWQKVGAKLTSLLTDRSSRVTACSARYYGTWYMVPDTYF